MTQFAVGGMLVAMFAVVAVLFAGLFVMVRGKDVTGTQTNRLMWMRVFLQGVALAFFALVLVLAKKNG